MDTDNNKVNDEIYSLANTIFSDEETVKTWMSTPIPSLSDRKPEDMLTTYQGIEQVLNVLHKIECGEFS